MAAPKTKTPMTPPPIATKSLAPRVSTTAPTSQPSFNFSVEDCTGDGQGQKILLYGKSGWGKTTIAMQAPDPVFICVDDGVRMLRHPVTDTAAKHITGVSTFEQIKALLQPKNDHLFKPYKTIVIDTITEVQDLAKAWVIANVKTDKGASVDNIEGYGYGKGMGHLYDAMRELLSLLEIKSDAGYNIILIAQQSQVVVSNAAGSDYVQIVPALFSTDKYRIRDLYIEQFDHVLLIGPAEFNKISEVTEKWGKSHGKALSPTTRAIHCKSASDAYYCKARGMDYEMVSFDAPEDNSIWVAIFNQEPNQGEN